MSEIKQAIQDNQKYLELLSAKFPTIRSVCTEIINLRAILNLPKGTEHFLSDLHGEYEAFTHIINNCSGVIREKVKEIFSGRLTGKQRAELCTLIYYPELKLQVIKKSVPDLAEWYEITLLQMVELGKSIATKYTRSKVRKAMPSDYSYIIDELLHADYGEVNQSLYNKKIMESILSLGNADDFIIAFASLIKRLAVDRLHIVGDIFDRGPRPDRIMDMLMMHHNVDIQWGNHDILWMGAAAGNQACVAAVLVNSAAFGNLAVLEQGYGINLRPLAMFAEKTYGYSKQFVPSFLPGDEEPGEDLFVMESKIYKALSVMMFKLEGQIYRRHPAYKMQDRMLLEHIDFEKHTVRIGEVDHPMADMDLPTINPNDPYALTPEEVQIMDELCNCFIRSARLQKHMQFLYSRGSMYLICNQNLLFHGCVPMKADGTFAKVKLCGKKLGGKALFDHCDWIARTAYFGQGKEKERAVDAMWYLWCGKLSPLFGRGGMTTFERRFIVDPATWVESKNPYYDHIQTREGCLHILSEFGLNSDLSHIINGHVPVRASHGESPIKGGGKLVVIDGGFCRAYHPRTGIAGYTLIYNSYEMRLSAHKPFESQRKAVEKNVDIYSSTNVFEQLEQRMLVMDTDIGRNISEQIYDLSLLLAAYRDGIINEKH